MNKCHKICYKRFAKILEKQKLKSKFSGEKFKTR